MGEAGRRRASKCSTTASWRRRFAELIGKRWESTSAWPHPLQESDRRDETRGPGSAAAQRTGPIEGLPRTAGWGYPEPYTRDLMISALGHPGVRRRHS